MTTVLGLAIPEAIDRVRITLFYGPLWWLTAQDRRLALPSNVESVK
jgi:hypothetical protein